MREARWTHASRSTLAPQRPAPVAARYDLASATGHEPVAHEPGSIVDRSAGPERRTVKITGRGSERTPSPRARTARSRSSLAIHERPGFKPDRVAMWAVLLGALLVLIAATSSHAAVLATHLPH